MTGDLPSCLLRLTWAPSLVPACHSQPLSFRPSSRLRLLPPWSLSPPAICPPPQPPPSLLRLFKPPCFLSSPACPSPFSVIPPSPLFVQRPCLSCAHPTSTRQSAGRSESRRLKTSLAPLHLPFAPPSALRLSSLAAGVGDPSCRRQGFGCKTVPAPEPLSSRGAPDGPA